MKALVYHGPGNQIAGRTAMPKLVSASDAIVRVTHTTICGTDLHILKGDVPTCEPGRVLGHEGVGVIEQVGTAVSTFKAGDHVLISCITSCGKCEYCRRGMYSHCTTGGWILGNRIDGTQAEYSTNPARRNESVSDSRRRGRRSAGDDFGHPSDRLRMWRAERQGAARQHGCDRWLGPDRPCCIADCAVLRARPDCDDRSRCEPAGSGAHIRRNGHA